MIYSASFFLTTADVSVTSTSTLLISQDLSTLFSQEKNGVGFTVLLGVIGLLLIISAIRIFAPFIDIFTEAELVALPFLVLFTVIASLVGMVLMLYYYINLRDYVRSVGKGVVAADLGNAIALVVLASIHITQGCRCCNIDWDSGSF